ncbi:MAG: HAMP domain-containing histidine kinase [Gemmatimonadetes bacterium]|nr:HAMP domain-containing histidine kinase [Gemmatimonadota bacterium]
MKNPLTPLRLAVHRIARAGADETMREPLAVLEEETGRLEELARQFAVLGRPSSGPRSDIDLAELLRELLATDVPPGIGTELHVPAAVPLFHGHYDALQRALRNIVRNAVEAIEIRRAAGVSVAGRIAVQVALEGAEIAITVRDNGCGIPPEAQARIFEPDFTLKARGTGLGLAQVRQAVLAHEGRVQARSAEGGGAELEVRLPLERAPSPDPAGQADGAAADTERTGTGKGSMTA